MMDFKGQWSTSYGYQDGNKRQPSKYSFCLLSACKQVSGWLIRDLINELNKKKEFKHQNSEHGDGL